MFRKSVVTIVLACLGASPAAQWAYAQNSGCDYWINHSIAELDERLESARAEFIAIEGPTKADLEEEYQIKWNRFKEQGHDPDYQMRNAPESWLRSGYFYRKYWETTSFVPTEQEVWIFCADTRRSSDVCEKITIESIEFANDGSATKAPEKFRDFYEESKQGYFEHYLLAAMIVDALPACDESVEAQKLQDKAFQYIREFQSRLWSG